MSQRGTFWGRLGALLLTVLALLLPILLLVLSPGWLLGALVVGLVIWLLATRVGQQTWSVTEVGILTIPQRIGSSLVVVVGIAGVVGVLVALLAMGAGFEATLKQTGTENTAIVLRAGAQTELNSVLDHDSANLVAQMPQVAHNADGVAIASPELVVVASLPKKTTGLDANLEIRGVGERAWELRPQLHITAGRKFEPGMRELVAGKGARSQFANVEVGSELNLNGQAWKVVGAFDSGDSYDSEIWGDAQIVGPTYRRGSSTTSVTVRLSDAGAFDAFKAGLMSDPRLKVDTKTTRAYYSDQSARISGFIRALAITVGVIMAIGAVFGALNTMYAAVATRTREIATLRAVGFRAAPVIVSVLIETMLLALAGGLIGAVLAWLIFDHFTASTLGDNFSQVVFAFDVSPHLLWNGLKWALAIGLVGGLFPALRAARMPVTSGLREL